MSELDPLRKKLERYKNHLTNNVRDVLDIVENAQATDTASKEVEGIVLTLVEAVVRLRATSSRGAAKSKELESLPEIVDGIADAILSIDNLDLLRRLDYIQLARMLDVVHPDLITETFNELATYPSGWEKLELIRKEAAEKLATRVR